ncbi:TRAP transporter small permease [Cryobacterium frigoriphilum]|uniref:TRAP transporter small permease n=1 Tax=Cryobacterium frigoriphilum TaxID=1259150 RepID=A0A4R9A780_9MICO|nr:TRAP transporter small permease [Cryobacterium frigoriphilum]TFD53557.1 TRAP transporter small permease [Cryobacterium frigoriphilum]
MKMLKRIIDKVLEVVCIALFAGLVLLVVWQVFTRFVLSAPSSFSEELATYAFVWLVMFGTAYVFGERGHMAMDFVKNKLPLRVRTGANVLIEVLVLTFAALVMVRGGSSSASLAWAQATGSIQIPLGYLYLALPISGVLIIFYSVYNILEIVRRARSGEPEAESLVKEPLV